MAFVIIGPFAPPGDQLDIFTIAEQPDDGKSLSSRKALRKEAAALKDKQRTQSQLGQTIQRCILWSFSCYTSQH
jgi:hypothetical protein